jgi:hypothetical protein
VTDRKNCGSIADHGFRESWRSHTTGVFLSPPGLVWCCDGMKKLDSIDALGSEFVAFAFDIPDDVAAQYAVYEEVRDDDPEPGDGELPFLTDTQGMVLYEYCVPAEVANRHCIGVVYWEGESPINESQRATLEGRRTQTGPLPE